MSFVADFANSLTTAPGTNAAKNQGKRNTKVASTYKGLFDDEADQYAQWQQIKNLFNPNQALGAAFNAFNESPGSRVQKFAAGANERANAQALQTANFLRNQGFGDGLVGGAAQGAFQNAAAQTNAYAAQQMDPQEQLRRVLAFLQSIEAGNSTYLGSLNALGSGVYGQPQTAIGSNPLMSAIQAYAGQYGASAGDRAGKRT